jgi:hypothetical protein
MEEQMFRRLSFCLVFLLLLTSCAVQRSKAPQIDSKTAYALNLETQVKQVNKDYVTFFTDLGKSQVSPADIKKMNYVGGHLKYLIEEADRLTKTYAQNYDSAVASQIGLLLAQAANDFSNLYVMRSVATGGK